MFSLKDYFFHEKTTSIIGSYFYFIILYFVIDLIWLKGAQKLHLKTFKSVTGKSEMNVNYIAIILFYLIAPLAFFLFIKNKFPKNEVFKYGAIMGLILYSTYDLTSKAIYNESYSWTYTFADIAWGTFVFGLVSYIISNKTTS